MEAASAGIAQGELFADPGCKAACPVVLRGGGGADANSDGGGTDVKPPVGRSDGWEATTGATATPSSDNFGSASGRCNEIGGTGEPETDDVLPGGRTERGRGIGTDGRVAWDSGGGGTASAGRGD